MNKEQLIKKVLDVVVHEALESQSTSWASDWPDVLWYDGLTGYLDIDGLDGGIDIKQLVKTVVEVTLESLTGQSD